MIDLNIKFAPKKVMLCENILKVSVPIQALDSLEETPSSPLYSRVSFREKLVLAPPTGSQAKMQGSSKNKRTINPSNNNNHNNQKNNNMNNNNNNNNHNNNQKNNINNNQKNKPINNNLPKFFPNEQQQQPRGNGNKQVLCMNDLLNAGNAGVKAPGALLGGGNPASSMYGNWWEWPQEAQKQQIFADKWTSGNVGHGQRAPEWVGNMGTSRPWAPGPNWGRQGEEVSKGFSIQQQESWNALRLNAFLECSAQTSGKDTEYGGSNHSSKSTTATANDLSQDIDSSCLTPPTHRPNKVVRLKRNLDVEQEVPLPPNVTTVIIRNYPRRSGQEKLLLQLEATGFKGKFDFVYLPFSFSKKENLGYVFVNFMCHEYAVAFYQKWHRNCFDNRMMPMRGLGSSKYTERASKPRPMSVSVAKKQGVEANITRIIQENKNANIVNPKFQPAIFVNNGQTRYDFQKYVDKLKEKLAKKGNSSASSTPVSSSHDRSLRAMKSDDEGSPILV